MFSFFLPCFLVIAFSFNTSAKVFENISLDNQLPLIARVGQFYNWTFSPSTFTSDCGSITRYTTSPLPSWLTFDSTTRSLHGTPSENDVGAPDVTITGYDVSDSPASSWCNILVTTDSSPTYNYPIAKQFYNGNPSLSSVFVPGSHSALASMNEPVVRIPYDWSFSVGFEWNTYVAGGRNVHYAVLQEDGSPLPDWVRFSPGSITLDGATPAQCDSHSSSTLQLFLHATDHVGYTAVKAPFSVFIGDKDLSMPADSLPTINVTASDPFNFTLNSAADFVGVELDGHPLPPESITELMVDVTGYGGSLNYDSKTRTLSGQADDRTTVSYLPATILAYNQTIQTNFPLKIEPSFFTCTELPSLTVGKDGVVSYPLRPYFSNATHESINISVAFDPPLAANYLQFDSQQAILNGVLPSDLEDHILATFTAYSHTTHSTSHASLSIDFDPSKETSPFFHPSSSAITDSHKKLILGLSITFGIVGGLGGIACLLAVFRHCARVKDSTIEGEEGQRNWSEKDKQWYGLQDEKIGYGWTAAPEEMGGPRMGLELSRSPAQSPRSRNYGDIGLGLRRVMERSQSELNQANSSGPQSPGVISKREFMTKIKQTVRNVSDRCTRTKRPQLRDRNVVIGKPILLHRSQSSSLKASSPATTASARVGSAKASSRPESVAVRSISHPRYLKTHIRHSQTPATVHFVDRLSRHGSNSSTSSLGSMSEAIVQTASRAASLAHQTPPERPRLVPFTSATRVPIPQMSVSSPDPSDGSSSIMSARVTSQTAQTTMWKEAALPQTPSQSNSNDELSMGIHYVRALGADQAVEAAPSTLTVSTNVRSSFSSLEASDHEHDGKALRMIVRVGEQFKFRVPVLGGDYESNELEARLITGEKIPAFLRVDFSEARRRSNGSSGAGAVEFYGLPGVNDTGDLDVRVCTKAGGERCIARVLLQIVKRS
ncbi:polarity establishment/cellular polarization [Paramarasmius palmivorus]|uniref:Polarity establishment/cellular polarization n=1 Tax=Paramarasmius palmivorus TaxID=297713 RepID=A0AAW0EB93_9AGAR